MDQETVERLLGGVVESSTDPRPVVLLLAAVRAAPRPAELAGEGPAVQAYRRALAAPAVPAWPARRPRSLTRFGGRAAVAALALAATGGVALATGTAPRSPHPPTATPPAPGSPPTVSAPAVGEQGTDGPPATTGTVSPAPAPSEMLGLCRAYRAVAGADSAPALDNPVFSGLVAAAGDRQRVADYCVRVLAGATPHGPTDGRPGNVPSRRAETPPPAPDHRPTDTGPDRTRGADERPSRPGGRPT
ncbi:hypothetical protein DKT68_05475 [Micromonospora acroterricola]|uniref:Uncharacterized protein n=2 Tax=Micromonospora acroterricola TaxID=2202421 RepID=A0A317DB76_9ACTN|nr:hypothetical protein DKT68_05475 [Micromonospora acroterricola]